MAESRLSANEMVARPAKRLRLVVLGGRPDSLPAPNGTALSAEPRGGFDVALVVGPVDAAALWSALEAGRALLAPVLDFTGGRGGDRCDIRVPSLTPASLQEALLAVIPILRHTRAIGDISGLPDREGLYVLGMAHSRQAQISAAWTAAVPEAVHHPLLGPGGGRKTLEWLAELGLLERSFFGRTNLCSRCTSARLNAFEACAKCGSANLRKDQLIHHYPCGAQLPEARFLHGEQLICPKCRKELRHIGVDYDRPGTVFVCAECGEAMADPEVRFVCLDCAQLTPSDAAQTLDWFHYRITADGVKALEAKRLPHRDMAEAFKVLPGALSVRDFSLVARKEYGVATRYKHAFSLVRLRIENYDALLQEHGSLVLDESIRLLVRLIAETLRASDSVAVTAQREIFIALPETEAENVKKILARLHDKIHSVMTLRLEITSSVAEGEEAGKMLETCQ